MPRERLRIRKGSGQILVVFFDLLDISSRQFSMIITANDNPGSTFPGQQSFKRRAQFIVKVR